MSSKAGCSSSDEEDDDEGMCVGFMFDSQQASELNTYEYPSPRTPLHSKVVVAVSSIGEDPGALISGHYLWPASQLMARWLLDNPEIVSGCDRAVELGAGCGLSGLVLGQIVMTEEDGPPTSECRAVAAAARNGAC